MSSKTALMSALFDQFTSFLEELQEMYPQDNDFPMFITTIKLLKSTNPGMLTKYIYENTEKFGDKIMSKDEDFFLANNFDEYSGYVDMNIFGKLKSYVSTMSPSSKDSVWKYCQNIFRLAQACQN
jgi:hypothetical protein